MAQLYAETAPDAGENEDPPRAITA